MMIDPSERLSFIKTAGFNTNDIELSSIRVFEHSSIVVVRASQEASERGRGRDVPRRDGDIDSPSQLFERRIVEGLFRKLGLQLFLASLECVHQQRRGLSRNAQLIQAGLECLWFRSVGKQASLSRRISTMKVEPMSTTTTYGELDAGSNARAEEEEEAREGSDGVELVGHRTNRGREVLEARGRDILALDGYRRAMA